MPNFMKIHSSLGMFPRSFSSFVSFFLNKIDEIGLISGVIAIADTSPGTALRLLLWPLVESAYFLD